MSAKDTVHAYPAFRFVVKIDGITEAAFTECVLPQIEWEIKEVQEGGVNTHTHQLPGRRKASRLTLKNGLGKGDLLNWYMECMNESFVRRPITIEALDDQYQAIMGWHLEEAFPIKWEGPQLQSDSNHIAIQTLVFACSNVAFAH